MLAWQRWGLKNVFPEPRVRDRPLASLSRGSQALNSGYGKHSDLLGHVINLGQSLVYPKLQ